MDTIRFVDHNYPGVIYVGTEAHMYGLGREGGCPQQVKGYEGEVGSRIEVTYLGLDGIETESWRIQQAPDFWAETDEVYNARVEAELAAMNWDY